MNERERRPAPRRVPDWFDEVRNRMLGGMETGDDGRARRVPSLRLESAQGGTPPVAGEIRALSADDFADDASSPVRLVLVRHVDAERRYASVALLGHDPRLAGGTDVVLGPERTELPYVIMVETDVVAPAWLDQLSGPLGVVDEQTLVGVCETEFTGVPAVRGASRGTPLKGPQDERWRFKLDEAETLREMCASCIAALERQGLALDAAHDATQIDSLAAQWEESAEEETALGEGEGDEC